MYLTANLVKFPDQTAVLRSACFPYTPTLTGYDSRWARGVLVDSWSIMDSTRYIGHVGALAVALGIGTTLASGTGVAWADTGSTSGKSVGNTANSSADSTASNGSAAKKPTTSRQGPLSKLGDQVRMDVESSLDGLGVAVKRTQSQLDNTRTRLSGKAAEPDDAPSGTVEQVGGQTSTPTRTRSNNSKADTSRITPGAVGTVPDLSRAQRPNAVPVRIDDATESITKPVTKALDETVTENSVVSVGALQPTSAASLSNSQIITQASAPVATPEISSHPLVSALLAAVGLSVPAAGTSPVAPAPSPVLWAVMAWVRREFDRSVNPTGTSLASANDAASVVAVSNIQPTAAISPSAAVGPNQLTPKPAAPQVGQTTSVGWVTGANTAPWFVGGTDLGIMWDNGAGQILTIFGDTFDDSARTTGWRNNVLFRTSDTNLSNGLQFDQAVVTPGGTGPGTNYAANTWWGPGASYQNGLGAGPIGAAQVILANPAFNGPAGTTFTMIPTSAISVTENGTTTQYVTVMSIRHWGQAGHWTTNYSAIASSTDGGAHWTVDPNTLRASGFLRTNQSFIAGNQNFQQNALVYGNAADPNSWTSGTVGQGEQYIYVYGTPSGRQGSAYVARVPASELTNLSDYQYWSGAGNGGWVTGDPSAATSVIGGGNSNYLSLLPKTGILGQINKAIAGFINGIWVIPTRGHVSEMSVQYNEYLGKYIVLYTNGGNNVVMRVSDSPQGEWSNTTVLVHNNALVTDAVLHTAQSGMYAPMIDPWSGTGQLGAGNNQYLYYNLSYWGAYNVALKQTDLSPAATEYT
jgi:hypothetical protein